MLKLSEIQKSYQVGPAFVEVLKNANLDVAEGEFLAIMGASGSGKSTLMNIMGLLDKPTSGSYLFEDKEITYDDDDALSGMRNMIIGFVFQHYNLLPRLTVHENVGIPLKYKGVNDDEIKRRSYELLKRIGIEELASRKPSELSGGQQQRAAIARALAGNPKLILADEPTGALDTASSEEIMDLFGKLNADDGITVVVITHNPVLAKKCKRLALLKDGTIIEQ
ncbi:MAG: ABC transporter ATP-binding protein [Nitrospirae bacterium]|nr:MAG: ABC transporter ATP-binding protein [Nitrospirota bacterium]